MAVKWQIDLVDLVCRTFGRPKVERTLPFLAISRGPYVRLQRRRRRLHSFDDGHDTSPMPSLTSISLNILSSTLYSASGKLSGRSRNSWWWDGGGMGVSVVLKEF